MLRPACPHTRSSTRAILAVAGAGLLLASSLAWALVTDLGLVAAVHAPAAVHADQLALNALPDGEDFDEAFELGDELFATAFNALDGGGANVGRGQRFTRVPRADLNAPGEWRSHTPIRVTGPNASGCFECHEQPFEDGSGAASSNVHRDAFRTGIVGQFVQRNTPHVFAPGAIQRLAEEMTGDLASAQAQLVERTCREGGSQVVPLQAKGVDFGILGARQTQAQPCQLAFDTAGVRGVDFLPSIDNPDASPLLIVRPFQWKGSVAFLRDFNRGAAHNEIGMQSVEIVGDNVDGDADGVVNELTIGDQTALAVYMAAQPRPTSLVELQTLGLLEPPLTGAQLATIVRGRRIFGEIGCASCHIPALPIGQPIFSEPSQNAAYRDGDTFPAGQGTAATGVVPGNPVSFDLTRDQPDNIIRNARGQLRARLGSFTRRDAGGRTLVDLYGDLKRHAMGPNLAEPVNEIAGDDVTPIPLDPRNRHTPDTFLTENLWGVGSTAPYMHDGRATTLAEAILEHAASNDDTASEARASRAAYTARSPADQAALIAFLENLVLFKIEEDDSAADAALTALGATRSPRVKMAPKGFRIRLP